MYCFFPSKTITSNCEDIEINLIDLNAGGSVEKTSISGITTTSKDKRDAQVLLDMLVFTKCTSFNDSNDKCVTFQCTGI